MILITCGLIKGFSTAISMAECIYVETVENILVFSTMLSTIYFIPMQYFIVVFHNKVECYYYYYLLFMIILTIIGADYEIHMPVFIA